MVIGLAEGVEELLDGVVGEFDGVCGHGAGAAVAEDVGVVGGRESELREGVWDADDSVEHGDAVDESLWGAGVAGVGELLDELEHLELVGGAGEFEIELEAVWEEDGADESVGEVEEVSDGV